MSHEDHLDADQMDAYKAKWDTPLRQTSETPKLLTRTSGYITVDIQPVTIPTPITVSRWLYGSSVVRGLLLVLLGVVLGNCVPLIPFVSRNNPPIVRPVTESLEAFAARELQTLSAEEQIKLIAITEKILAEHFETTLAIRETFRDERLLAGINSSVFNAFSEKWHAKIEEMQVAETVEAMRQVYESLLRGLKIQAYSDFTGGSVEGFVRVSPSIIDDSFATDEDGPDPQGLVNAETQTTNAVPPKTDFIGTQRQPIFRRR